METLFREGVVVGLWASRQAKLFGIILEQICWMQPCRRELLWTIGAPLGLSALRLSLSLDCGISCLE